MVIGVGAGLGAALARRFAKGYRVAMIARTEEYLAKLAKEIAADGGEAFPVPANVASAEEIKSAFDKIRRELGTPEVLLVQCRDAPFGRLMETKPSTFENTWRVATFAAFLASQEVVPDMIKSGKGVILFTGATAGVKPFATSAAFGPAKFALRGLAQVMARDLQPQRIHVAYINVDGPIDMPFIRQRVPEYPGRGHAEAVGDCGILLAPRASGSERMDARARCASVQGESSRVGAFSSRREWPMVRKSARMPR